MNYSLIAALSPIFLFLLLSILGKWSQVKVGLITLFYVLILGFVLFEINFELIGKSFLKSIFVSIDVLLIIWSALFLHNISVFSGTLEKLGSSVANISNDRIFTVIFFGWLFPSFLQGIGGFGVPVAICAPLLISAGFSPVTAVILPSIGHAWSITFGSMGSAYQAMLTATSLTNEVLGSASSIILGILSVICGMLVAIIAEKGKNISRYFGLVLILGSVMGLGQYIFVMFGYWSIAVALASITAIFIGILFVKFNIFFKRGVSATQETDSNKKTPSLRLAILPYILIVVFSFMTAMIKPIRTFLSQSKVYLDISATELPSGFFIPQTTTKAITILNHPGTIIFISALISIIFLRIKGFLSTETIFKAINTTFKKNIAPSFALFCVASIAIIMDDSQMLFTVAEGISVAFSGVLFPVVSPFIGAVGAFITGSNANSNVIFSSLQMQTASLLSLKKEIILAEQTAGGAIGSVIAPSKIIVGCSTVNLENKESQVYKELFLFALIMLVIVSLIALMLL